MRVCDVIPGVLLPVASGSSHLALFSSISGTA